MAHAEEALDQFPAHIHGERCILIVRNEEDIEKGDDRFVRPMVLGRLSDHQHGYFFRVTHYVDYYEAVVFESYTSERQQVWPCNMWFKIELMSGNSESDSEVVTVRPWWYIKIAAKNPSPRYPRESPIVGDLPMAVGVKKNYADSGNPERTLKSYLDNCCELEARTVRLLQENGRLYYIQFSTLGRMIVPSTSFKIPCGVDKFQPVADWIENLRSDKVKDTKLSFEMFFSGHPNGIDLNSMNKKVSNFRKAIKLENSKPDYFLSLYGTSPEEAKMCSENSLKDPDLLPEFQLGLPLIWDNITMMYLIRSLDMKFTYYKEHRAIKEIKDTTLEAYTFKLSETSATYGALIKLTPNLLLNTKLVADTAGKIEWTERPDMDNWKFVVGGFFGIIRPTDIPLIIRPIMQKDDNGNDYLPGELPDHMIDLQKAIKDNSLKRHLSGEGFERVKLHIKQSDHNETQQYKALQLANPETLESEKFLSFSDPSRCTRDVAKEISAEVTKLLSGQGLKEIGQKSVYSAGFIEKIRNDMDNINKRFAKAINKPGATLSAEQLECVLYYPARAPADWKMLCNAAAGSSKSTCLGVYMSFQWMDAIDLDDGLPKSKRGLLLTQMHRTNDTLIASITPIVYALTGKHCAREYTDKYDIPIMMWILNGCPDEHLFGTGKMAVSESAQVNNLIEQLKSAVKLYAGNHTKRFAGYEYTAVWIASKELDMIKPGDGRPNYTKKKPAIETSYAAEELVKHYETVEAQKFPGNSWQQDYFALVSLLKEMLRYGSTQDSKGQAAALMRKFKQKWYLENAAVIGGTNSIADSSEVMQYNPTHIAGDEWQHVSDANCLIPLTAQSGIPMYFFGDTRQPSPYIDDARENPFHVIRKHSWFELEIERGREHMSLKKSYRTDKIGVEMASDLFYNGVLESAVLATDPEHEKIKALFKRCFKTSYRHLLMNTGVGKEEKIGPKNSIINQGVIKYVVKLIGFLVKNGFSLDDIAIVAPYDAEEKAYSKILSDMCIAQGKAPLIAATGSILAMMGREAKIVIFSIAKTNNMGFLNTKGFWCAGMTRSRLSTIIVVNDTALQQSSRFARNALQYDTYNGIVKYIEKRRGRVDLQSLNEKTSGAGVNVRGQES